MLLKSSIGFYVGSFLLLVQPFPACGGPWVRQQAEGFRAALDTSFRYAKSHGFLQIPRGGQPGTTSNRRPKLDEVGIHTVGMGDASLSAGWGNHSLYGGARIVRLSGEDVLDKELISRGTTFPAGSRVELNARLDWYRVGYRYRFSYANDKGPTFSLNPGAGVTLFNFDYKLNGPGALSADRGFLKGAPEIMLESEWSPGGPFSLSGGASSSLPFSTLPFIFSLHLTGRYQLWGRPDRGGMAFVGIGYDRIDFKDNQRVPNHIEVDMGPVLLVGLGMRF